jgi:deoxyribodipyrimidine photo-lyase
LKKKKSNGSGEFYKVFTPYSKVWLEKFSKASIKLLSLDPKKNNFYPTLPLPIPIGGYGF